MDAILAEYQALEMNENESVNEFASRIGVLETRLIGVGQRSIVSENLRALLRGLQVEYSAVSYVIRAL